MSSLRQRVDDLNSYIQQGRIMDAMREFYADDVAMSENGQAPTEGLEANLAREQHFVDNTEWHGIELKGVAVGDDISMVEWFMDFTHADYGGRLAFTQVAVQRWRNGKIYDERFYYNPNGAA